jgi:hypothetical protein
MVLTNLNRPLRTWTHASPVLVDFEDQPDFAVLVCGGRVGGLFRSDVTRKKDFLRIRIEAVFLQ